jgi:hypothetical protein
MSTTYPPYIEEPTGAVVPGVSGPPTPVLPGTICNYNPPNATSPGSTDPTDGWAFIQVLKSICPAGTVFTVAQVNDGPFQVLYPAGETRRQWTLFIVFPSDTIMKVFSGDYGYLENWMREWLGYNDVNGGGIGNPGTWALARSPGSTSLYLIPVYTPIAPPPPPPPPPPAVTITQLDADLASYNAAQTAAGQTIYVLVPMAPGIPGGPVVP